MSTPTAILIEALTALAHDEIDKAVVHDLRAAAARLDELERENARLREMFALLPKAASEAMISAAEDAASDHFAIDGDKGAWLREDGYKAIWQAMTVAALAGRGEK